MSETTLTPEPGDRVRVGPFDADAVRDPLDGKTKVSWRDADGRTRWLLAPGFPPDSITVIRRPLAVGDVTTDGDALNALPVGSIVETVDGKRPQVLRLAVAGLWRCNPTSSEWRVVRVGPA